MYHISVDSALRSIPVIASSPIATLGPLNGGLLAMTMANLYDLPVQHHETIGLRFLCLGARA